MVIYVHADQTVEVRAPLKLAQSTINAFVANRSDWIEKQRRLLAERPVLPSDQLKHQGRLLYLGRWLDIEHHMTRTRKVLIHDNELAVYGGDRECIESRLLSWQSEQALKVFSERCAHWHARFEPELPPYHLKVRRMRRQWGNCRTNGRITLSLQLIRYPVELIDYVVVHELCHMRHMNHGEEFHALMTEMMPDWRERKIRLNSFSIE